MQSNLNGQQSPRKTNEVFYYSNFYPCIDWKMQAQEFIPLWPEGKKPNFNGKKITDSLYNERIWRVTTPGIYAFVAPKAENKGTAY